MAANPDHKALLAKFLQPKGMPKLSPDEHVHLLAEALKGPRTTAAVEKKIRRLGDDFIRAVRRDQRLRNATLLYMLRPWLPITGREIAIGIGRPDSAVTRLKREGALPQHVRIGRTDYWSAFEIIFLVMEAKIAHLDARLDAILTDLEKALKDSEQSMGEAHATAVAILDPQDPQDIGGEPPPDDGVDHLG